MDHQILEEFNAMAKTAALFDKVMECANIGVDLSTEEFKAYMDERVKAQYAGPQYDYVSDLAAWGFIVENPDFVPESEEQAEELTLSLQWELNALNNSLDYDFERFGVERFTGAVNADENVPVATQVVQDKGWKNLARLLPSA